MRIELASLTIVLAWMLSSESLILLGNGAGNYGITLVFVLALFALVSAAGALCIHHPQLPQADFGGTEVIRKTIGDVAALSLTLASRLSVTILAACGMLVTAGFAFNEIFVYWFPNFAFASILLALLVIVNILGRKRAQTAQVVFMSILLAGIAGLLFLAVTGSSEVSGENHPLPQLSWEVGLSSILLFLGYDLAMWKDKKKQWPTILFVLFLAFVIFGLWTVISVKYVPLAKLADSTIPHIQVARELTPPFGRFFMGAVIIAGSCAAVNALFMFTGWTMVRLSRQALLPAIINRVWQGRLVPVVLGIVVVVLMFTGLAGEEILETYLRGALLLWLLHMGVQCFAASRYLASLVRKSFAYVVLVSIVFIGAVFGMLLTDDRAAVLIRFMLLILAGSTIFSIIWLGYLKNRS